MNSLDLTENQRVSFQDRLPERVAKRDPKQRLCSDMFEKGYLYAGIDFGLLMSKPDRSAIVEAFVEVEDNAGGQRVPLLFFSRPSMPIYVAFPAYLHWVDQVRPMIYLDTSMTDTTICIATLERFMEAGTDNLGH